MLRIFTKTIVTECVKLWCPKCKREYIPVTRQEALACTDCGTLLVGDYEDIETDTLAQPSTSDV